MEKQTRKSKPRRDLTGQTFGYLTPFEYIKGSKWKCKCQCGKETIVDTRNLTKGHTTSCGCKKRETKNVVDMLGFENDTLRVLGRAGSDDQQIALWECECKLCGRLFITRGSTIRKGTSQSCGCIHSLNERKIIRLFEENNIEYSTQYTFPDLYDKGHLRFDFAVFQNGILSHLIEYNGKQHYEKPLGSWSDGYKDLIKHDKMKEEYCKKHNIRLIVIPYNKDYTINDLL